MKIKGVYFLLLFVVSLSCAGQTYGPKDGLDLPAANLERVGVGTEAPDFTLLSKDNRPVTLSSFAGNKNVILVYYRGYW